MTEDAIPVKMLRCKHTDFFVYAAVNIIEDTGKFAADITIRCADCEMPFQFLGLPVGLNMEGAAVSVDRTEARLAIAPYDLNRIYAGFTNEEANTNDPARNKSRRKRTVKGLMKVLKDPKESKRLQEELIARATVLRRMER